MGQQVQILQSDNKNGQILKQQPPHQICLFVPLEYHQSNDNNPNRCYGQIKGISDFSNFYLRLVNTRRHERELCLEQFRYEGIQRDQKYIQIQKEQQQQALQGLEQQMSIFQQPVLNLDHAFKQLNQIKQQIIQKKQNDQFPAMMIQNPQLLLYSPYLREDWFQINYVIIINLLKHVKYGQDIMHLLLNKNQTSLLDMVQTDVNLRILDEILLNAYLLKLKSLEEYIIKQQIFPIINKDNVIRYTQLCLLVLLHGKYRQSMYEQFLNMKAENNIDEVLFDQFDCESQTSMNKEIDIWIEFYKHCLSVLSQNIIPILQYNQNQFFELKYFEEPQLQDELNDEQEIQQKFGKLTKEQMFVIQNINDDPQQTLKECSNLCERILYKSLYENWNNQQSFDFSLVVHAICKVKGLSSIFKLLQYEKDKLYQLYFKMKQISGQNLIPSHEWRFDKLERSMYKNDDPFIHNNAVWRLGVTYYRQRDATMKINLNLAVNPFQDKNSKVYYKKNEFFLPSNSQLNSHMEDFFILPKNFDDLNQNDKQNISRMKEIVENTLKLYPQHNLMSFLTSIKINNEHYLDPQVQSLIVSSKSPCVIQKIKCFMIEDYIEQEIESGQSFKISIFIRISKIIPIILSTISKNFFMYFSDPGVSLLDLDDFKLILKHKRLQVLSEDDICTAFFLWAQNPINNQESISQLVSDINWNYVSLPCLLNLIKNSQQIRSNNEFQILIQKEFQMRLKFSENPSQKIEEPRFCYKYFKTQQQFEMIPQDESQRSKYIESGQYESKNQIIKNNLNFWNELIYNLLNPIQLLPLQSQFSPIFDNNYDFLCSENFLNNLHVMTKEQALQTSMFLDIGNVIKNSQQSKIQNSIFVMNVQNMYLRKKQELEVFKERMLDMGIQYQIGKTEEEISQFQLNQLVIEKQKEIENLKAEQYKDTLEQQKQFQDQILQIEFDIEKQKKLFELQSLKMLQFEQQNTGQAYNLSFSNYQLGKKNIYNHYLQRSIYKKKINQRAFKRFTQLQEISQFLMRTQKKQMSLKIQKSFVDLVHERLDRKKEKKYRNNSIIQNLFKQKVDVTVQTNFQKEIRDIGSQCDMLTDSMIQIQKTRIDELEKELLKIQLSQNLKQNKVIQLNLSKVFEGQESSLNSKYQNFSFTENKFQNSILQNSNQIKNYEQIKISQNEHLEIPQDQLIPKIKLKESKKSLQTYLQNNISQNDQNQRISGSEQNIMSLENVNKKNQMISQSDIQIDENILNTYYQMDQNPIFDPTQNKIRQPADLSDLDSVDEDCPQEPKQITDKYYTQRYTNTQNMEAFKSFQNSILTAANQIKQQLQTYRIFSQLDANKQNYNSIQEMEQISNQKVIVQDTLSKNMDQVNQSKFVKQNAELISQDAFGDEFLQKVIQLETQNIQSQHNPKKHRKNNSFVAFQNLIKPMNTSIDNNNAQLNQSLQDKNENKIEIQEILNIFDHLSHPNVFYKTAPFTPNLEETNQEGNYISKTIDESFGQYAQIDNQNKLQNQDKVYEIQKTIKTNEDQKAKSVDDKKSINSQGSHYQIKSNDSQIIQQSDKYNLNVRQNMLRNDVILNKIHLDEQFENLENNPGLDKDTINIPVSQQDIQINEIQIFQEEQQSKPKWFKFKSMEQIDIKKTQNEDLSLDDKSEADAMISEDSQAFESIQMEGPYTQRAQVIQSSRHTLSLKVEKKIQTQLNIQDKIKKNLNDIRSREQSIKQQIEENKTFFSQNYGQVVLQYQNSQNMKE